MQPRSALFDQTVAGAHTILLRADILSRGKVIATGLPVTSGSVVGNRTQFARRTCTVVIPDPAYIPTGRPAVTAVETETPHTETVGLYSGPGLFPGAGVYPGAGNGAYVSRTEQITPIPADLLAPYGNEIRVWRGAVTPAGPELICLGTFGIRSADFADGGAFKGIEVTGVDRCKVLMESRFTAPRTAGPGSALATITSLVTEVLPWVAVRVDPDVWDVSIPQVSWAERRDQAIIDTLAAMGCEAFFSPMGEFVIQPIPSPNDPAVFTVSGGPGGILVGAQHNLSRDGVFNGVIARGSSTAGASTQPVSDLIVDSDPTSPTFWGGPFGQVPGFYDSSLLLDKAQANNAAQAMLLNQIGAARSINYSTLVNPALEPGDVVAVVDPGTGAVEQHLQDQLTIPLDTKTAMTAQTRSTLGVVRSPRKRRVQLYGGALS